VVSITPRPRSTPGERAPGTHCIGGWVGPRAGLDAEVRGKVLCLCRGSNPCHPVRSQTLYWLSYRAPKAVEIPSKNYSIFINLFLVNVHHHLFCRFVSFVVERVPWNKSLAEIHNLRPDILSVRFYRASTYNTFAQVVQRSVVPYLDAMCIRALEKYLSLSSACKHRNRQTSLETICPGIRKSSASRLLVNFHAQTSLSYPGLLTSTDVCRLCWFSRCSWTWLLH
jgi:hypothetical protein